MTWNDTSTCETWDDAASLALWEIESKFKDSHGPFDDAFDFVARVSNEIHAAHMFHEEWQRGAVMRHLAWAGTVAWEWLSFNHCANQNRLHGELLDMLVDRHHKYGPGNINRFKELGLIVRLSDKVARLRNLQDGNGAHVTDETVVDTWMDIVGYTAIAIMLRDDTFDLPLA